MPVGEGAAPLSKPLGSSGSLARNRGSLDRQDGDDANLLEARPDHDLHILVQERQQLHELFHGEFIELVARQRGHARLRDAEDFDGFDLLQLAGGDDLVDRHGEPGLGLPLYGVRQTKIGKDVPRTFGDVVAH